MFMQMHPVGPFNLRDTDDENRLAYEIPAL